jgi:glycosyltransferase involved in cell wall biosynthesis
MNKILIITDTTLKQTNGVVRTLNKTIEILSEKNEISFINPERFKTISLPFYKEIDISLNVWKIGKMIEDINPDFIHIATEGPVGLSGKLYCDAKNYAYTTSYHSMFPEFIKNIFGISENLTYPYFKWFHSKSKNILVPTNLVKDLLTSKGFNNLVVWKRGVDRKVFNSSHRTKKTESSLVKIILCVSRVSKEKGLDDFCKLELGSNYRKIVVGDGPYLEELLFKYPNVLFVGKLTGKNLSTIYANADVFVFPSKNDTFGLTQLEAIASGTPVLAYRGTVSEEIIREGRSGFLVEEFGIGEVDACLTLSRKYVEDESYNWTWKKCTKIFEDSLVKKIQLDK